MSEWGLMRLRWGLVPQWCAAMLMLFVFVPVLVSLRLFVTPHPLLVPCFKQRFILSAPMLACGVLVALDVGGGCANLLLRLLLRVDGGVHSTVHLWGLGLRAISTAWSRCAAAYPCWVVPICSRSPSWCAGVEPVKSRLASCERWVALQ